MRKHPPTAVLATLCVATLLPPTAAAQEPNFGRAIVTAGNEAFIGQPVNWYGPGTVTAYRADASGGWREAQRLMASDTARMDDFGRAIAAAGNTLVVGAPRKRDGAGVVYLFSRTGSGVAWRQQAMLEAPAGGEFGAAVALMGDDLLVGAPSATGAGAVYHFRRQADGWRLERTLPITAGDGAGVGTALAFDGTWLLVGAPGTDSGTGAAWALPRGADGAWGAPQRLTVPRTIAGERARVGSALLLAGQHAYIGAPGAGAALMLSREGRDRWAPAAELHPFDGGRGSQFGHALAQVDGEVWVGAPGANRGRGRVYRFLPGSEQAWAGALAFDADSATAASWPFAFGYTIAAGNGSALVGMPSRDFGEGRVMVARPAGDGWRETAQLTGEIFAIGGASPPAAPCDGGTLGVFTCSNIDLVAHLPTSALGGDRGAWVNDVWGWTDPATRRDYALVARRDGISFVDVTTPSAPRLVGNLPRTVGAPPSVWRDVKVYGHHAYVVADGADAHGMQVFDLTHLRGVGEAPATFAPDTTYHEIFSAHNVAIDTTAGFAYILGANGGGRSCGGGLHIVDIRTPGAPTFAGCHNSPAGAGSRGYTHDAQCVIYRGPDARFQGRELCIGSNESEIQIADVTDKASPRVIGRNSYPNVAYAHQGWFDDEQRYFYMNDELDELAGTVEGTRTIVWDLTELDDPVVANMYIGPVKSSDHNLFVKGNRIFEANYGSGLRVLDISDRTHPREIAHFDSAPFNDDGPGHSSTQSGAWSVYPYFASGVVVFTSVREGLFLVKVADLVP